MKKIAKNLLTACVILAMGAGVLNTSIQTVFADGWIDRVKDIQLDTVYSESCSSSDYYKSYGYMLDYYYDAYKITVPASGVLSVRFDAQDSDYACNSVDCYIYNISDLDNPIIGSNDWTTTEDGYSSGRDMYYRTKQTSITAGTYYLVFSYYDSPQRYTGTYDFSVNYQPSFGNTYITKIKAKNNAFKLEWAKAGSVTGYQIKYSLKKNMKNSTTITVANARKNKYTIKKLKNKKKYYVKVRSYKSVVVEGIEKTYYGSWSAKAVVKTR